MEKILIIKLGALGDFAMAIGGMMKVRQLHPDAELTLMTATPFLTMARQMGIFSHIIIDNRVSYFNLKQQCRLFREIIGGDFDYIYDFQAVARTKKKYFPLIRWLMPHSFNWVNTRDDNLWHIEKTRPHTLGKKEEKGYPFTWPVSDLGFLHGKNEHFGELPERFVLLIPGCSPGHPHKRWPASNYAALAQRLAGHGIASVIIGTQAEAGEANTIAAATPLATSMLNKTSLLDVPDLARRAYATVGNDTGPSHMASLAGVPTIGIYDNRTRNGALRGPRSINLISPDTIEKITVERVWENLLPFLKEAGALTP